MSLGQNFGQLKRHIFSAQAPWEEGGTINEEAWPTTMYVLTWPANKNINFHFMLCESTGQGVQLIWRPDLPQPEYWPSSQGSYYHVLVHFPHQYSIEFIIPLSPDLFDIFWQTDTKSIICATFLTDCANFLSTVEKSLWKSTNDRIQIGWIFKNKDAWSDTILRSFRKTVDYIDLLL